MNPSVKKLWLAALRSGEYKQICGRMRVLKSATSQVRTLHGEGHCCLGVLTELAKKEGVVSKFSINHTGQKLVSKIQQWAGISPAMVTKCITLNDGSHAISTSVPRGQYYLPKYRKDNKTFAQIADYIEREL